MRRASDVSRRRRVRRITGRAVLIVAGVVLIGVIIFGRALARFYVDYLWHDGLGRADVFWGVIRAKATLFALFFAAFVVIAGVNLFVADRLSPKHFPANVHPVVERFHDVFGQRLRLLRYVGAVVLGVLTALPTMSQWQSWMLFRHRQSFDQVDAQFGADIGFYVFELPFLSFVLDWLFAALVLVLVLTILTHVLNGGVLFASPVPSVRPSTKGHLAVLLALLAALKAADYWLSRYDTTNERRGFVQGATYAVVNAQLPALMLLMLVALLTAALYLSVLRTGSWRLPVVASGLWLVVLLLGGYLYPAAVQGLVVNPNQQSREAPYIARNVEATRAAMGIADVTELPISFGRLDAQLVREDPAPLQNVRLLNPIEMLSRFRVDEGQTAGLTINDIDVDRYPIDGELQQVLVAARELDLRGIANQSWQGRHLINTRGCGIVMAPTGQVSDNDRPVYQSVDLNRQELYFSPSLTDYAVANTSEGERSCPDGESTPYEGTAGVRMSSFVRRAAFALAFFDYNVLGSAAITQDSQMLWVRDVRDRLDKLAPFLSYDGDPYPVVLDGRVLWVVDAYTSTANYPYAQRVGEAVQLSDSSGIPVDANYIRNSVKAVVDAYDGSVRFYVVDPSDPVIQAWSDAFGDLFSPASAMPPGLVDHLRYPEDLFRVQTDVYSKYRLEPEAFFQRTGAWSVAQAPSVDPTDETAPVTTAAASAGDARSAPDLAAESSSDRFIPYYTMFQSADEGATPGDEEFVMLRPFVPFSRADERTELAAYMTASSDPATYGRLIAYVLEGPTIEGPRTAANQIDSAPEVTRQIANQTAGNTGNEVRFGDLQLVPISDGLLYVRPLYAAVQQSSGTKVTEYRFVTVAHSGRAAIGASLEEALANLFPGYEGDLGDRVETSGEEPPPPAEASSAGAPATPDAAASSVPVTAETPDELLTQADQLFAEADEALAAGDLGAYQDKVNQAADLVARARDALAPTGTT